MFTGIISDVGEVEEVESGADLRHLHIACSYPAESIALGASIACAGVCLTVTARGQLSNGSWFEVDAGLETLARTTAKHWRKGTRLNLERALRLGDELGGHILTGHVDGVAEILAIEAFDAMRRIDFQAPENLSRLIAEKGSVALDGTSLTVNRVEGDIFSVLLIPHTLKVTTWGTARIGMGVNLEVDLLARYAAQLTEARGSSKAHSSRAWTAACREPFAQDFFAAKSVSSARGSTRRSDGVYPTCLKDTSYGRRCRMS